MSDGDVMQGKQGAQHVDGKMERERFWQAGGAMRLEMPQRVLITEEKAPKTRAKRSTELKGLRNARKTPYQHSASVWKVSQQAADIGKRKQLVACQHRSLAMLLKLLKPPVDSPFPGRSTTAAAAGVTASKWRRWHHSEQQRLL